MASRVVRARKGARRDAVRRHLLAATVPAVAIGVLFAGPRIVSGFEAAPVTIPVDAVTGGAPTGDPRTLTIAAADLLEQTTATGGAGYRFEILQRSTLVAKLGGPQISIPDPNDRTKTLGKADRYEVGSLVETGFVHPKGFSMEMRTGPVADGDVDVTAGDLLFRTLVRGGKTYRDDGRGWYPTDQPPGIGLDPFTADLLPRLLRNSGDATNTALDTAEGDLGQGDEDATRAIEATGKAADIPGVIAVDGATFTQLTEPIAMTFDDAGRLVGLLVTARNTSVEAYDLVVVTEITLHYDNVPQSVPLPEPAWEKADDVQVVQ